MQPHTFVRQINGHEKKRNKMEKLTFCPLNLYSCNMDTMFSSVDHLMNASSCHLGKDPQQSLRISTSLLLRST